MMKHYHNYNNTNYDYIGAEFITDSTFLFGIFECQATYANQVGSWPAFWSFHQLPCPDNEGPEIDFAEYSCQSSSNKLLSHAIHHWPAVTCGDSLDEIETGFNVSYQFAVSTNIYKSIWTPGKIEYYVDGVLKEIHAQNGTEWFPDRPIAVYVSQQINTADTSTIVTPQTSFFKYVRVKKFFLSPEISCPDVICSSSTANLDVDPLATNISWNLSPGYMFSGSTSGNGSNATITPSTYNGTGKITYSFQMPSGETFSAEKTFGVKGPRVEDISLSVCKSDGTPAQKVSGTWLMCPNTTYHIYVNNDNTTCSTSGYSWNVPSSWTTFYTYQNMISVNTNSSPGGPVSVQANTCCNNNVTIISTYLGSNYNCGQYYMIISPNPAENETLLSLQSKSEEVKIDERVEWGLEVYDQTQLMVVKKIKLKGENQKLDISGWKEGIYFIRTIYKGEVIESKLAVKK